MTTLLTSAQRSLARNGIILAVAGSLALVYASEVEGAKNIVIFCLGTAAACFGFGFIGYVAGQESLNRVG